MTTAPLIDGHQATTGERNMACVAHILQIFASLIAPLIIYLMRRESKFVAFHALQAVFLQLCHIAVTFASTAVLVAWMMSHPRVSSVSNHVLQMAILFFPVIWVGLQILWGLLVIVAAIVYGVKANRGEWAQYPVIGGWARHVLHI